MTVDGKGQWVHIQLGELSYETLMIVATNMGIHTGQAAAQLLESALAQYMEENSALIGGRQILSDEDRAYAPIYKAYYKQKRREQATNMIKVIAARVSAAPSEESVEELRHMAEIMGMDFGELMDATTSEMVMALASETSEALSIAKRVLLENMAPGVEYRMKDIKDLLDASGVGDTYQKRAKAELKIKSRRKSGFWVWYRE